MMRKDKAKRHAVLKAMIETPSDTRPYLVAKVGKASYYKWLKDPDFIEDLRRYRQMSLARSLPAIDKALIESASMVNPKDNHAGDRRLVYELAKEIRQQESIVPVQINIGSLYQPDQPSQGGAPRGGKEKGGVVERESLLVSAQSPNPTDPIPGGVSKSFIKCDLSPEHLATLKKGDKSETT